LFSSHGSHFSIFPTNYEQSPANGAPSFSVPTPLYLLFQVVFFTPFVYFFSGLNAKSHGGHFFIFLLVIFLVSLVGAALVRFMVTVSPTKNRATAATGET
jgi:hypothetical protein